MTLRSLPEEPGFAPPRRLLLGPGPSNVAPRVLEALSQPPIGHLDPAFLHLMDQTMALLRAVFQTDNRITFPISATGSAGMEAAFVNLVEPGDRVLVCVNGVFGERMAEVAARAGAQVSRVEAAWGEAIDPAAVEAALDKEPIKVLGIVHAETSTGVLQPVEEILRLAVDAGALTILDTVTSLGGVEVAIDHWGADVSYSGTQKCLSAPPGLAPITFGQRATARIRKRSRPVQSWYLDATLIERYIGKERLYHHTAPVNMVYALREALRLVVEEGLAQRWHRHRACHFALAAGLEAMGIDFAVPAPIRLPVLNSIRIPAGLDGDKIRGCLLRLHGIEIGSGLGKLRNDVWRIGLMGEGARLPNVERLLTALAIELGREQRGLDPVAALEAARHGYKSEMERSGA